MSQNKKILIYGFVFTFFSSFGQSFFLGLFNPSLREELQISHGQFGSIYATATIFSSLLLIWFGKKIDDFNLIKYSFLVVILLSISCLLFSFISNIFFLIVGIFLMRFSGQGLMSHTSTTAISRYFNLRRGKALSAIWFGLSSAEFILPVFVIFLLTIFSWQLVWQLISLISIIFLPIILLFTIKNISIHSREKSYASNENKFFENIKQWKRNEVLKDPKFYIISLNMLAMPWIITGVFVYQSFIAEAKFWDEYTIPKSFMIYSITSIFTLILSGFLVDKFTSRRLMPLMNIPLLIGLIILLNFDNPIYSFFFFGLVGVSNGLANVLGSSTWAEVYGVRFIGGIKALTTALMVFSTAFGTAFFGFLIDNSFSIERISLICIIYISLSLSLLLIIRKKVEPIHLIKKA